MSHLSISLFPATLAFVAGLMLAPLAVRLCGGIGWVDKPDVRKLHDGHVPLAGGLTIVVAVLLAALVFDPSLAEATHFWLSAGLIFAVGFIDDRIPIRARYRFFVQVSAAFLFAVLSGASVNQLGELLGPYFIVLGALAIPFTIVGIVGLTNAINMIDGVDGLAGGLSLAALAWLLVVFALLAGDVAGTAPALLVEARRAIEVTSLLIGAMLAFLVFNQRAPWRKRAAMFLGDGGSMCVGFLVAALLVYAAGAFEEHGMPPVTAVWIAAVPLLDLFTSMLRRIIAGTTPMTPDRKHLHHLLIARGLSPASAVLLLQGAAVGTGLVGVIGWRLGVPQYWMFWGIIAVYVLYFFGLQRAWQRLDASAAPSPSYVEKDAAVAEQPGSGANR
jgi:UDP-GlcNAc:undecaprenyl-phosphate/decaprenyl-phosphate GlcNAc-1-phosphate transferase